MSKHVLDLSIFREETYDIKFSEEDILHIKKPTEELSLKILAHANTKKDDITVQEMLSITRDMTISILNHNRDERTFSEQWVRQNLPLDMQIAIINGYTKFMMQLEQNPN